VAVVISVLLAASELATTTTSRFDPAEPISSEVDVAPALAFDRTYVTALDPERTTAFVDDV
jgi:hypothetical protein